MNERLDSVWDLLVARITALEARVEALEGELAKAHEEKRGWLDRSDEEDGDWIVGNDG